MPLFNGSFALLGHVFHGSKRFCLYHFNVFLCFSSRIWQHFDLHLAPKCTAFSTKTPCVLQQNVLCLVSKRIAFSGILHYNLLQIAPKQVQMAAACNKYSFCLIHRLTSFCNKTNLRENRLFAVGWAVGGKNLSYNVKIYAEKIT